MKLRVGQVLYVVPTKQMTVYPMQVIEELTKKTLNGVEIDYVLKGGGGNEPQTIKLNEIQGEIFETSGKARAVLVDRATKSIARMVDNAVKKSQEWYPGSFEGEANGEESMIDALKRQGELPSEQNGKQQPGPHVTLADGTVVRVKLPDVLRD